MRLIRAAGLPLSRWHNGAGRKADILTGDGWLIGFAWLDADAPFSDLAGMDRTITLVEGPGFTLEIDGKAVPVGASLVPTRFDGGRPTFCRVAGPSRVLNAMTARARWRHAVTILDGSGLDGSGTLDPGDSVACVVVALDAPAEIGSHRLDPFDAAVIEAPTPYRLWPGGRAACMVIHDAR